MQIDTFEANGRFYVVRFEDCFELWGLYNQILYSIKNREPNYEGRWTAEYARRHGLANIAEDLNALEDLAREAHIKVS